MFSKWTYGLSTIILILLIGVASAGAISYANSAQSTATPTAAYAVQTVQPTLVPATTFVAAPTMQPEQAAEASKQLETVPFMRTELLFGSERPNKPEVSPADFKRFLDAEVTPRFPDGLTLLTGFGQFREESGEIVQETSFVLVLLYPQETAKDSSAKIEEIRALYLKEFEQESVLRVDDPRPVRVSF